MKRSILILLACSLLFCTTACKKEVKDEKPWLDKTTPVTLTILGRDADERGLVYVGENFHEKYPNVTVVFESIQNYSQTMLSRAEEAPESFDLFVAASSENYDDFFAFSEELYSNSDKLDLSSTNKSLVKNAEYNDPNEANPRRLYHIPVGAELRGMMVNKTLLAKYNLSVPKTRSEFLNACQVLKDNGYIPIQGNPGALPTIMIYPYIFNNIIHNADKDAVAHAQNADAETLAYCEEPMSVLYNIMENYYYDYKTVETKYNMFKSLATVDMARDFFNIKKVDGEYVKQDDIGTVAFCPKTMSGTDIFEKTKADYHSEIDFEFVLIPVTEEGGYAYFSPSYNLSVNSNSANKDWAFEFLSFMFEPEVNTNFAKLTGYVPNTTNSFETYSSEHNLPTDRVSDLGQITFNYDFYTVIGNTAIAIMKGNAPKYTNNGELYPLSYYMDQLAKSLEKVKASL